MRTDLSALSSALRSADLGRRQAAAEKLAQLGRSAQATAVPLIEACEIDDAARQWIVAALEDLGPPPAGDVAKLASLVKHPSLEVAYWAATLLGRLEAQAAPAVDALTAVLASHAELAVRERAVWALAKIGPAAGAAGQTLRKAAADKNSRLARLAREAIKSLPVIALVLWSASAARGDTPLTVYNQSPMPILVWVKPSQDKDWGQAMQLQSGEQKTYTLRSGRVLDVRVRYYTSNTAIKMIDREARYLSVERAAQKSQGEATARANTATSRITSQWLQEGGRWEVTGFTHREYNWRYYACNGGVELVLPQDTYLPESRIPRTASAPAGPATAPRR